ncbi:hypothetical protein [Gemmatimonas sp.]
MTNKTAKKTATPQAKRPYVGRLTGLKDVKAELARLYRAARLAAGEHPSPDEAYKLGMLLTATAKLIESSELEARLAEVERRTAEQPGEAAPLRRVS